MFIKTDWLGEGEGEKNNKKLQKDGACGFYKKSGGMEIARNFFSKHSCLLLLVQTSRILFVG